jgi:Ca2+-binding RTX toxin-like protein
LGIQLDNLLKGAGGSDTLEGGLGDDVLDGGAQLEGGGDMARFSGAVAATVDLTLQASPQDTGYGYDTLIGIENLEGGSGDDVFIGDHHDNVLIGNDGSDRLTGGKGNDFLDGGDGRNTAVFSGARDDYTITKIAESGYLIVDRRANGDGEDILKYVQYAEFSDQLLELPALRPETKAASGLDAFYDMVSGNVHLNGDLLPRLRKKGQLKSSEFWSGAKAHDATDRIIHNTKTGELFYDPDGTGKAAVVLIATLPKGHDLAAKDFFIL